jgi:hypothetical protein
VNGGNTREEEDKRETPRLVSPERPPPHDAHDAPDAPRRAPPTTSHQEHKGHKGGHKGHKGHRNPNRARDAASQHRQHRHRRPRRAGHAATRSERSERSERRDARVPAVRARAQRALRHRHRQAAQRDPRATRHRDGRGGCHEAREAGASRGADHHMGLHVGRRPRGPAEPQLHRSRAFLRKKMSFFGTLLHVHRPLPSPPHGQMRFAFGILFPPFRQILSAILSSILSAILSASFRRSRCHRHRGKIPRPSHFVPIGHVRSPRAAGAVHAHGSPPAPNRAPRGSPHAVAASSPLLTVTCFSAADRPCPCVRPVHAARARLRVAPGAAWSGTTVYAGLFFSTARRPARGEKKSHRARGEEGDHG